MAELKTSTDTVDIRNEAPARTVIRMTDVSKAFSGVQALANISVEFFAGEVHAILGENGAGKSTLMNIITGVLQPDTGRLEFEGRDVMPLDPEKSSALGISISYQHPAILEDMSVQENLQVALPADVFETRGLRETARRLLDEVGLHVPLNMRTEELTVAQKHLLELAKALALNPKVLILDEPTASLDQDATDMLFARVRDLKARGTSVIYITHRLAELRKIADRVTVLRDGRKRGSTLASEVSNQDLLDMIVGRKLESAFPQKCEDPSPLVNFEVNGLTGRKFADVEFEVGRGQIIGIAGVEGNGQVDLMRALAGLQSWKGTIKLDGKALSARQIKHKAAYMPSDRHSEGVAKDLTVRENATVASLEKYATGGVLSRRHEDEKVQEVFRSLAVKASSTEAKILSLSGGNQQKVVMSRALLSEPGFIIADEPTQGVDVGARFEIYRILREVSNAGTPVIVNSSDAAELKGLCDVVVVMSRGRIVKTLRGDEITEPNIVGAAVAADTETHHSEEARSSASGIGFKFRRFVQTDNATVVPLTIVAVLLALYIFWQNENYLSSFNVSNILILATALGFIALGQTIALLMGGIDLSVGPLAGFLVVIGSFFVNDGQAATTMALGFVLMFCAALLVGLINGCLIRFGNFTPIAATLTMFIGLQGMSFVLRDGPGGYIAFSVIDTLTYRIGSVPIAFILLVFFALVGEWVLRRTRPGWQLRAVGSNEESARRIGVRIDRTFIAGYIAVSLLTFIGAIMLMAQIGVGDPAQGVNYTLGSITAVVLGGTSLRGGRGTFIGTVLGALLLTEVLNAVSFLGLSQTFQYGFQGFLILVAALIYSTARRRPEE
ncbi:ATP-binding cassette domain-containing protein [Mesorhizobium xinjiangense]|uniref:ATP-binding cassette domain-containing protein n=1 Tax=Mesorhizobium xinjiangense TaxID=2678685 RepID=UPI0018DB8C01|nr:ATP-binding cassette domain-containing protein [Mesorhizobium xinjiangense]